MTRSASGCCPCIWRRGDYASVHGECASTVEQFKGMAARLDELGQKDEALAALRRPPGLIRPTVS